MKSMVRWRIILFSVASVAICVAAAGLWIGIASAPAESGTTSSPSSVGYSLGHGIRFLFLARADAFSLYNQPFPYTGSVIGVASAGSPSPWPREIAFDFPGIYFRHFTWPGVFPGGTYWTLTVSWLWPLGLIVIALLAWTWRRRRIAARQKRGACVSCGYDLRASPTRCPECGALKVHDSKTA